ncbi:hypothetical protein FRC02_007785 [Tulasnella sp. 418]|nr:hypothetical protein FRC02_007785 [Tulasnella sp. 418]
MATPNLTPLLPSMNHSAPALDPLRIPGESMELHSLENLSEHSKRNLPTSPSTPFLRSPGGGVYHPKHAPSVLRTLWVVAALPVLSLSYLIFCYIVDHKLVKVSLYNVDVSVSRMNIIKAGVTSINILIITVALLPLRSLVGDLQGEEFFRVLTLKRRGVPLSVVNQVSTPSYGFSDKLGAVLRRQSSGVFAGAFVASLIAIIASTLAPATLSVQVVQVDDELQAFRVGAIFRQSVWK